MIMREDGNHFRKGMIARPAPHPDDGFRVLIDAVWAKFP